MFLDSQGGWLSWLEDSHLSKSDVKVFICCTLLLLLMTAAAFRHVFPNHSSAKPAAIEMSSYPYMLTVQEPDVSYQVFLPLLSHSNSI